MNNDLIEPTPSQLVAQLQLVHTAFVRGKISERERTTARVKLFADAIRAFISNEGVKPIDAKMLARIAAAIPPTMVAPAVAGCEPAVTPLERLVAAKLFGRKRDRDAIAAAWDEATDAGLTMRDLVDALPESAFRAAALRKLQYSNRHGT